MSTCQCYHQVGGSFIADPDCPIHGEAEMNRRASENRYGRNSKRNGVRFMASERIARPNFLHERWHRGTRVETTWAPPFVTLEAPGWYNGKPLMGLQGVNCLGISDLDPGPCVVCQGKSNERRHMATVQNTSGGSYLLGHLCRVCAKEAFKQWASLLDDPLGV